MIDNKYYHNTSEWRKAQQAIDALANALPEEVDRLEFLKRIAYMATTLPYGDLCSNHREGDWMDPRRMNFPYKFDFIEEKGWYKCHHCGKEYTVSFNYNYEHPFAN